MLSWSNAQKFQDRTENIHRRFKHQYTSSTAKYLWYSDTWKNEPITTSFKLNIEPHSWIKRFWQLKSQHNEASCSPAIHITAQYLRCQRNGPRGIDGRCRRLSLELRKRLLHGAKTRDNAEHKMGRKKETGWGGATFKVFLERRRVFSVAAPPLSYHMRCFTVQTHTSTFCGLWSLLTASDVSFALNVY